MVGLGSLAGNLAFLSAGMTEKQPTSRALLLGIPFKVIGDFTATLSDIGNAFRALGLATTVSYTIDLAQRKDPKNTPQTLSQQSKTTSQKTPSNTDSSIKQRRLLTK